jgi:formamidopyrimidine-DNA glycosylase
VPELPDIALYLEALRPRVLGQRVESIRVINPFTLRSFDPPITAAEGREVVGLRRMGKRIVFELEGALFLVIHLMIAGRLRWSPPAGKPPGKPAVAAFTFPTGVLVLREAGSKRRASIHLVAGEKALGQFERGGLEVLTSTVEAFAGRLRQERHTLKRSLTDPRLFSGIGNAYSDEILHRAKLSPLAMSDRLDDEAVARLHRATREVLEEWIARLRSQAATEFPDKVTAFRPEMAVHGRFREPCPVCGAPIQRIRYAENETNYCARCQTGGRLLADRTMSRLLREDWPRSLDEAGE